MKKIIITSILLTALITGACSKHHHDDKEHSSVKLTVVREANSLSLEMRSHRDALFAPGKKEPPTGEEVLSRFSDLIRPDGVGCVVADKKIDSEKKGHHEIYIVSAKINCQSAPQQLSFGFAEVYPSVKEVHVKMDQSGVAEEKEVSATDTFKLN